MATLGQISRLLRRRATVLAALALAVIGGAVLFVWQTRQLERAAEMPPASSMENAAARREMPARQVNAVPAQAAEQVNDKLTHDFGVVSPGSVVKWAYPIENTSDFAWTIDKVKVLCRCTVPGVSAPTIAPGKRESVTLQLDCGDEVADIVKAGTVYFNEPGAKAIQLIIKASVRAPMTPSAREISFGGMTPRISSEQVSMLANYSPGVWKSVRVDGCPSWCEVEVLPPIVKNAEPRESIAEPREIWRIVFRLVGNELAEGYNQAAIHFRADAGDECEVFVTCRLEPAVRIVPEKLVFGPARPGESCVRVARVIVQTGIHVEVVRPAVDARHISVTVRRVNDRILEVKARLVVPRSGAVPDGQISLSFDDDALPDAALPYSLFEPKGSSAGG